MEFNSTQRQIINGILKTNANNKENCLHELKMYLSTFQTELRSEGMDFAFAAYTIWNEYANK
jgi:hypothetical protein